MADDVWDVLVLGSGVAGLTAALLTAREGVSTSVLCPEGPGGALLSVEQIEDYPGFPDPVSGYELGPMIQEQAQLYGARFNPTSVKRVVPTTGTEWLAEVDGDSITARALIVATGSLPRPLDVPGAERLEGRGISHCASCDGPLYKNRPVAVVGNGNTALHEALTLSRAGATVTMMIEESQLLGAETYRRRVESDPGISIRPDCSVVEVNGESVVSGLSVRTSSGDVEAVPFAAIFSYVGRIPNSSCAGEVVELDERSAIIVDVGMGTSEPGIFAAGDVRAQSAGYAISSAGDGATAAMSALAYLQPG